MATKKTKKTAQKSTKTVKHGSVHMKESRIKKGLTQIQAAKLLKTKQPNLSGYETGKHTPSLEMQQRIRNVFGTPIKAWLVTL